MTIKHFTGRRLSHPTTIWCLFALILTCITIGLVSLSEHALRLNRERQESQARERLQQDTVVALWRLDSRLAPFIATLLDPRNDQDDSDFTNPFVKERFTILNATDGTKGEPQPEFSIHGSTLRVSDTGKVASLPDAVTANAIMKSVNQLLPSLDRMIGPTSSQGSYTNEVDVYANNLQYDDRENTNPILQSKSKLPSGDLELLNRNEAVQQQIAFNYQEQVPQNDGTSDQNAMRSDNSSLSHQWNAAGKSLMTVWVNDQLFVLRPTREDIDGLDGVWVDWEELKNSMASDITDLLPEADFLPVEGDDNLDPTTTLAALPARLVTPDVPAVPDAWSPTHKALLIAWFTLLATAVIAAVFLQKLIVLSERRATFVSAVTHELRTPLTTFRLYTDLLSRDMVSDPADRKEYLETLRQESDRLTHLIDNVLRYSKLERTSTIPATEVISLADWIDRITPRLIGRLNQSGMMLEINLPSEGQWKTDPPAMEQVIFNLVDNAAKYAKSGSDSTIHLTAKIVDHQVVISVADHGPGVPATLQHKIFQPFSKSAEQAAETAAGVGLGLALARQTANAHGGTLTYESTAGGGATFVLRTPTGLSV
jgi:signal transduction histidine kinase